MSEYLINKGASMQIENKRGLKALDVKYVE